MPERIAAACPTGLPSITVVDLRRELKAGNRSIFSRRLQLKMKEALKRHEQVILYLNRRGGATFVQCRTCGHVIGCRRCQVPMSYHFDQEKLVCHHCNYRLPVPTVCPECRSRHIKYLGLGTQAVARDTASLLPDARILRWDSDTTRPKDSHQGLLKDFSGGKADILIGTQMIAKGLEFPGVSLVGVINADTGLNLPDFRAGERTFSLLSQIAGRAGRGLLPGEAIIQSYWPEHYAIQAMAKQDYAAFYHTEIEYRRELNLPPFSKLIRLTFYHRNDDFCRRESFRLKTDMQQSLQRLGIAGVSIVGPAPAFIHRLRGLFRWNIFLKGQQPELLLDAVQLPRHWRVDVDPVGLE
jgi:primosomal protein N' (replication factor Y)